MHSLFEYKNIFYKRRKELGPKLEEGNIFLKNARYESKTILLKKQYFKAHSPREYLRPCFNRAVLKREFFFLLPSYFVKVHYININLYLLNKHREPPSNMTFKHENTNRSII